MRSYLGPINWPEFDEMFNRFYHNVRPALDGSNEQTKVREIHWSPALNLVEISTGYELTVELPGMEQKDVEITFSNGELVIKGERKNPEASDESTHRHWAERQFGKFERSFMLGPRIDESRIEADFKNGILSIKLPKRPEVMPKQIEIKG